MHNIVSHVLKALLQLSQNFVCGLCIPSLLPPRSGRICRQFCVDCLPKFSSAISVVAMSGAAIAIDDASAADTVLSIKRRVFASNDKLPVRRQRIMYRPGPHGINPLADDETLDGAGVAQDGSAELDVLLDPLTADEAGALVQYGASSFCPLRIMAFIFIIACLIGIWMERRQYHSIATAWLAYLVHICVIALRAANNDIFTLCSFRSLCTRIAHWF